MHSPPAKASGSLTEYQRTVRIGIGRGLVAAKLKAALVTSLLMAAANISTVDAKPGTKGVRLDDLYQRIEIQVSASFRASCQWRDEILDCALNEVPVGFYRLLARLHGGKLVRTELPPGASDRRRGRGGTSPAKVRFVRLSDRARILEKRLEGPPRWVIVVGVPLAAGEVVANEIPFRPYPQPSPPFPMILPDAHIEPLDESDPAAPALQLCLETWRAKAYQAAIEICERLRQNIPGTPAAAKAALATAEAWIAMLSDGHSSGLKQALAALARAERATGAPARAARYVLVTARVMSAQGRRAMAERLVARKQRRYEGTAGAPALQAGRTALLMQNGDRVGAERAAEALSQMSGQTLYAGGGFLLLAGLAYERGDYARSLELYDVVRAQWPHLIAQAPASLLQLGELSMMHDRNNEAEKLYAEFLERFPGKPPHWIARVRLAELLAYHDPDKARATLLSLVQTLDSTEGITLARLRYAAMTRRPEERLKIFSIITKESMTGYPSSEIMLAMARLALEEGDIRRAYEHVKQLRALYPHDPSVTESQPFFDRVLYLLLHSFLEQARLKTAIGLYYHEREAYDRHARRDAMHLIAGRALRSLALTDEALSALQRGLQAPHRNSSPKAAAEIYLEMAGVLRDDRDVFRLGQILDYLDRRHPNRFDNHEYWLSRGAYAQWSGNLEMAKDIYVYALNGPVTDQERVDLAGRIADVYADMGNRPRAVRALRTLLDIHDTSGGDHKASVRRDAAWLMAELEHADARWPDAVAALADFISAYPDDEHGSEAQFLLGRSLIAMGDDVAGARRLDNLRLSHPGDPWAKLAEQELAMLRWRRGSAADVLERAEPTPTPPVSPEASGP